MVFYRSSLHLQLSLGFVSWDLRYRVRGAGVRSSGVLEKDLLHTFEFDSFLTFLLLVLAHSIIRNPKLDTILWLVFLLQIFMPSALSGLQAFRAPRLGCSCSGSTDCGGTSMCNVGASRIRTGFAGYIIRE